MLIIGRLPSCRGSLPTQRLCADGADVAVTTLPPLPFKVALISRDDDAFLDFVTPRVARYSSNPVVFARRVSHAVLQMARFGAAPVRPVRLMPRFLPGETA